MKLSLVHVVTAALWLATATIASPTPLNIERSDRNSHDPVEYHNAAFAKLYLVGTDGRSRYNRVRSADALAVIDIVKRSEGASL